MNAKDKKLLEYLIRHILREESFVTEDPLYKAFILPFKDVIDTARMGVEKTIATRNFNLVKLAGQFAVLAIPFYSIGSIDKMEEEAKKKISERFAKIDLRYADVIKRNLDTIRGRDVWGIGFLLNPSIGLGTKAILHAPEVALSMLEILTGGMPKITALKQKAAQIATHIIPGRGGGDYSGGGGGGGGGFGGESIADELGASIFGAGFGESIEYISEKTKTDPKQQLAAEVQQLMRDPQVQQKMQTSTVAQQMKQAAFEAVSAVVQPVIAASSYEQLKSVIGPEFDKFEKEYKSKLPKDITPEQLKQLQEAMLPHLKRNFVSLFGKQLEALSKQNKAMAKPIAQLMQQFKV